MTESTIAPARACYRIARAPDHELLVRGQTVFLAVVDPDVMRHAVRTRLTAAPDPFRANMSHEIRLHGWCGTTNNVSSTACGVGVVTAAWFDGYGDDVVQRVRVRVAPKGSEQESELVAAWRASVSAEA